MSDEEPVQFRCLTCHTIPHAIDERVPDTNIPILEYHKDCDIHLYTEKSYQEYIENPVTPKRNKSVYGLKWFIHKARIINRMGLDFNRTDFCELTAENFRQLVYRAKKQGLIIKTMDGIIPSFRVVGEDTGTVRGDITLEGMGVGVEFEKMLRDVRVSYPKIHDLKLKAKTTELYAYLKNIRAPEGKNGRIYIGEFQLGERIYANVSVYPKTLVIDLACSTRPIIYDTNGALNLVQMLGDLRGRLALITSGGVRDIPSVMDWIVTHYHFNKDGSSRAYSGTHFEVKVKEMSSGLIRFYSKIYPNGKTRVRLEQLREPKTKVLDEITIMVKTDNYVNGKAGIRLTHEEAAKILDIVPRPIKSETEIALESLALNKICAFIDKRVVVYNPNRDGIFCF